MENLTPSMRLKVKRDTFFLPDPNRGVYFRNNLSSFRMEGSTIAQWIEKLLPMFNGDHSLRELTDGLPGPYRDRVWEIAGVLYRNGFVRDISQDRPHQLSDKVLINHASQIEFLESFSDSGANRFQTYRQEKVLAVGSGPFFISLVSALIESGLPKFHILITDSVPTNRIRLKELVAHARKTDLEVSVEEINLEKEESSWQEIVRPFNSILFVSQEGDVEELRELHAVCRQEKKVLLPAISLNHVGLAGPLVHPDSMGCWESAWRRIHQSVLSKDQKLPAFSSTAGAMLANVIVFELFKKTTGVTESEQNNQFYMLDMETLEGNWNSFIPHPLVTGNTAANWVQDFELRLNQRLSKNEEGKLFIHFSLLTSEHSGIFHSWDEGDLKQLPLAQCRVQVVDPMSEGPAELLPDIICTDLTHEGARREAGLTGIESYASETARHLMPTLSPVLEVGLKEFVGIGAGVTFAECVCRGLQKCLEDEFGKQQINQKNLVARVQLKAVEDERCLYYLQALTTIAGEPTIGLGGEMSGFPLVWVGTDDSWYGCVGLNKTMALRNALQQAVMKAQNQTVCLTDQVVEVPAVFLEENEPLNLVIPTCEETTQSELLQSAMKVLERNRKRLLVFELELEPFLKKELAGVFGVLLREEESR
ncbi:putative thiazole-containing bacteriocin maturation protein [Peribacillus butanolivorans]|uniref:Thiazole-containing bacteriocin maturation protein n=1 Tax=Peribacillus butanolivorans TaxID=421767 RepID=A0AAX0S4N3_9BACI|nr:putative thiazole-containing bacteriocin maturation protein [Peribacillus butanolivorans]PEJ33248.1 putative thiazole-containing bacteriocin maturation protein [Peribacillus butanolivorans]